ncbi:MmcQ/YjbR family DNA-binding protein [Planosporangium thailandense]|uniref:MmcQ/YjbR family DNA-binding protein n=1 Tax=Planosporangium thailandense TaxID=765197 RepID=A0ABX0XUV5_9ACTN|nr:MmcQ/YjbR family DNA-binding protein [Planosporangium thailandense]
MVSDLPEAEEVFVAEWGHPTLRVRGKMFASGAPDSPTMSVKASKEEQAELVAARPEAFSVAAYVGRYGWVTINLPGIEVDELRELLVEAWRRTAPKRLVAAYDGTTSDSATSDSAASDSAAYDSTSPR